MTIEIGEKCESGIRKVFNCEKDTTDDHLGDIVKTDTKRWLAIPLHYRNMPITSHKLQRDAIAALR